MPVSKDCFNAHQCTKGKQGFAPSTSAAGIGYSAEVVLWYCQIVSNPSGKFVIRMPRELHRRLREDAASRSISLNRICLERLENRDPSNIGLCGLPSDSPVPYRLVERLVEHWGSSMVGIVLFGSAARGEATSASDIDLLLVFEPGTELSRQLYAEWDELLENHLQVLPTREISPQLVCLPATPAEAGGLWYEVAIEGIVLWERGLRISRFLCSVREALARGEIMRRTVHGTPYWIKSATTSHEK